MKDKAGFPMALPHIGWNSLFSESTGSQSFINSLSCQYFVHSYVASGLDSSDVLFNCVYGGHIFVAAVQRGSVIGFQFHPERGGFDGLAMLALKCQELLHLTDGLSF